MALIFTLERILERFILLINDNNIADLFQIQCELKFLRFLSPRELSVVPEDFFETH